MDATGNVGLYPSLALTENGSPVVSDYDSTNGDLKVITCGDPDCSSGSAITRLDPAGDVGLYSSLRLVGGNPSISY